MDAVTGPIRRPRGPASAVRRSLQSRPAHGHQR